MPITREEYIQKYGIDPEVAQATKPVAAPERDASEGLQPDYFAKSVVTGALSIPTDFVNLFPTLYSAGKAAWNSAGTDKTWAEEFQKNNMIEDAQKNVQSHFDTIAQSWKAQKPGMTEAEIQAGLAEYQKTKMFEDFMTEQKSGTHYAAAKWKDTVRGLLGDQRTEAQRSWTDSAAEVIGGAVVPGPTWTAAGARAGLAGVKYLGTAANTLPGRVALKTAELATPLTMPYSGANVAANVAVGSVIDQGSRYAQGQSTPFTPTKEDTAGIGTLGAIAVGVGAFAAIVGAVKGRSQRALQAAQANPSQIEATLSADPTLDSRVRSGEITGEAFMEGGPDAQRGPSSSMEKDLNKLQYATRTMRNQIMDQGGILHKAISDIHGISVADELTRLRTSNTGPVLADRIPAAASKSLQGIYDAEANIANPNKLRAVKSGQWMTSYASDISTTYKALADEALELQARLQRGRANPQALRADANRLQEVEDYLQRLRADDRSARLRIPDVEMKIVYRQANEYLTSIDPDVVAHRNAVKAYNREMLDLDVSSGRLDAQTANMMHARNPYYVQARDDPFGSMRGNERLWTSVTRGIRASMTQASKGTGAGALSDSPLRHLTKDVQPIQPLGAKETRITTPLDTTSAMSEYARRTHVDHAHTTTRTELIQALHTDRQGNQSQLVTDGRMRALKNSHGNTWWEGSQTGSDEFKKALDNTNVADEWSGGRVRLWEFGDPEIARALRMEPIQLSGLMKAFAITSNMAKFWTTGRGAPWFAPTGAMYNMMIAIQTRHWSKAFGPVSYAAHRWTPEWFAKYVVGGLPDYSALAVWPYHITASLVELQAYHLTRPIARELAKVTPFAALQQAVGPRTYQKMVNTMLKVASWADQTKAATLYKAGATFGQQSIDNIPGVKTAFNSFKTKVPAPLRATWQFYTDLLDSIWLGEKRMYYSQNHALLSLKHKGNIPQRELDGLINEARTLAGDMSLIPASKLMRDLETALPYLTQTKLGTYHLMQHMTSRDTMAANIPRLMITMGGVAQSFYMMTYWNNESRKAFWEQQPEHERYQYIWIPSPTLLLAWARGENPAYSRDLVYRVRTPPDFAGVIAGTAAIMQMMGILPADATPRPLKGDVRGVFMDNLTPAMPPLAQVGLGLAGKRLDPSSSETRGGNWIRDTGAMFRSGAQAESTTNLGQVSNSTTLVMSAAFGVLGGYIAQGIDVMLHAAKYHPQVGPNNQMIPRTTPDFGVGLQKALTTVAARAVEKVPDIPLIWQNKDRYTAATPSWKFVAENTGHIEAIKGMTNDALKKAANARRAGAVEAGGIPTQGISDVVLAQIGEDVTAWNNPTGAFGQLKAQYDALRARSNALAVQYNLPHEEKQRLLNENMVKQQDVKKQQQLAIQYAEQIIAQKYGMALKPLLNGRFINMRTVDELMRENVSAPAGARANAQQVQ